MHHSFIGETVGCYDVGFTRGPYSGDRVEAGGDGLQLAAGVVAVSIVVLVEVRWARGARVVSLLLGGVRAWPPTRFKGGRVGRLVPALFGRKVVAGEGRTRCAGGVDYAVAGAVLRCSRLAH